MILYDIIHYTILYYTILYYTILYYTILYYTILYFTILYYTILYYTILYYTILYYTNVYIYRYMENKSPTTLSLAPSLCLLQLSKCRKLGKHILVLNLQSHRMQDTY